MLILHLLVKSTSSFSQSAIFTCRHVVVQTIFQDIFNKLYFHEALGTKSTV